MTTQTKSQRLAELNAECALAWTEGSEPNMFRKETAAHILAQEQALSAALRALEHGVIAINHFGGARECMPLHNAIKQIKELQ